MKRVLLVEDDATVARIYEGLLRMEGLEPLIVPDGEQALESLGQRVPDLILLDLMLPKMSGVEVLRKIRATPGLQKLPAIVFTNAYMAKLLQEAWQAGATECLIKSQTSPRELMKIVRTHLAEPQATPEIAKVAPAHTASPPAPPPSLSAPADDSELAFLDEMRQSLLGRAPRILGTLRRWLKAMAKTNDEINRQSHLVDMCRTTRTLTSNAGLVGLTAIAQLSSALEALLKELHTKPSKLNASSLRTLAQGVDGLDTLLNRAACGQTEATRAPLILVVDDNSTTRRVICSALERVNLRAFKLDSPSLALRVLQENQFDLIFLDVRMPEMDGFELCKHLREGRANKATPVVFVTALNDLEARGLSILSGGDDLIAKPFLFMELTVKALVYVLRPRSTPQSIQAAAPNLDLPQLDLQQGCAFMPFPNAFEPEPVQDATE
jgi:CheY-like chemotaxis protein